MEASTSPQPLHSKRNASMDLLRIIAMVLVMMYHGNFLDLALDETPDVQYGFGAALGLAATKSVSMVCVNLFVLISGWFGIRATGRKLWQLVSKTIGYSLVVYLLLVCSLSSVSFSLGQFGFYAVGMGYWFVPAYILLFLLSPMLNAYIERVSKRDFGLCLLGFFILSMYGGFVFRLPYFNYGCSPLHFILLYLLARYFRLYSPEWLKRVPVFVFVFVFVVVFVLTCGMAAWLFLHSTPQMLQNFFSYMNPLNICLALNVLLLFSRLQFSGTLVSVVGTSAFAAYLVHCQPVFYEAVYYPVCRTLFLEHNGFVGYLLLLLFIAILFSVSVTVDVLWRCLKRYILGYLPLVHDKSNILK